MRSDSLAATAVRRLAIWPPALRLAQSGARTLAGRHHVAATAVVVTYDGSDEPVVLLARHAFRGDAWGLLGGWVRRREAPERACVREVSEESGLAVRAREILGCDLHEVDGTPLRYGGITLAFRCELIHPMESHPQPRSVELGEIRWFAVSQCGALITDFERSMIDEAVERLGSIASP